MLGVKEGLLGLLGVVWGEVELVRHAWGGMGWSGAC